jgi:hypothetical protein
MTFGRCGEAGTKIEHHEVQIPLTNGPARDTRESNTRQPHSASVSVLGIRARHRAIVYRSPDNVDVTTSAATMPLLRPFTSVVTSK